MDGFQQVWQVRFFSILILTGPDLEYNRASELSIAKHPNCRKDLMKMVVTTLRKNIDGF